jgi:hypothetical protein
MSEIIDSSKVHIIILIVAEKYKWVVHNFYSHKIEVIIIYKIYYGIYICFYFVIWPSHQNILK